ncbi:MAG: response regulator [Bacteroidetes bacterium]|nr:response regulator [Bacteroidota bacterium]
MKKILAIDDQQDNLTTIVAVIKSNLPDCVVLTALSGEEGLKIAKEEQPDTILLDIIMPKMDGYEVCKRLKADVSTKHIPVVMITAIKTDSESRVKGLNLGADAFLSKPIDQTELSAQVNVMLRIKEAEDRLRADKKVLDEEVKEKTKAIWSSSLATETSMSAIFMADLMGVITYANASAAKMWGYQSTDEMMGTNALEYWTESTKRHAIEMIKLLLEEGSVTSSGELVGKRLDGSEFTVESNSVIVNDEKGNPVAMVGSFTDITERLIAKQDLETALKKATESDQLKSAFLATMSHELRTPLNAVIGFSQLLDKKSSREEVEEFANRIHTSGNHLLNIIEDIFDITLIEAEAMKTIKENQNIRHLMDDLLVMIKAEQEKLNKPGIDFG